jgi:hypothetical protein
VTAGTSRVGKAPDAARTHTAAQQQEFAMPSPITKAGPSCLTAYQMLGSLQTEAFKNSRLQRADDASPYSILTIGLKGGAISNGNGSTTDTKTVNVGKHEAFELLTGSLTRSKTPVGWFDFVITVDELNVAYVRRSREAKVAHGKTDPTTARGHSSIARGGAVVFAGELLFGGEKYLQNGWSAYAKSQPGELFMWTNKTGHYYVGGQTGMKGKKLEDHVLQQTDLLKNDAGKRMLPINLFQPWNGEI